MLYDDHCVCIEYTDLICILDSCAVIDTDDKNDITEHLNAN
jgi:hypothetical protein